MTTLPERLLSAANGLKDWEHGYHGSYIASESDDAASLATLLREAAQALQAQEGGVLVPKSLHDEVIDQLIDLSNEKAEKGHRYRERERESDSDILRRFRESAAPSPSAALQAGEV